MEPMTLGSPVSNAIPNPSSPGGNTMYLPSFLLGDTNLPTKIGGTSPQDNSFRHLNATNINMISPISQYGTPDYRINRQKAVFGNTTTPNTSQIGAENHVGGPPTRGLFDIVESSPALTTPKTALNQTNQSFYSNHSKKLINSTNNMLFPDSPLSLNNNESQGLLQWVTVFGFPPNAINTVLSHISSKVRIIDKHSPPLPISNWIHLKCASEQETQRALACNSNIVSGSIMIGVIPCTDEAVILSCDKENRSMLNGSMKSFSTFNKMDLSREQSTPHTPIKIKNARPLVAGYSQHLSPQSVTLAENVPQKSTGLVTKAMEYVFGW
ncbi:PREDICTED: nucleoporin NUP53 [Polistes canadensis]|uniref:nucleoporin NUP53 n=1 Tax=Polistes canadensis TaxID=91411 RepID=UPI000718B349|nr:PREDICTED: nucleoporin NUP53 [Polistes canadensis]